jgi:spore maturation protein CgeB
MRIFNIFHLYPEYLHAFYKANKHLKYANYSTQLQAIQEDAFAWNGAWIDPFTQLGYSVEEVYPNAKYLQRVWSKGKQDLQDILLQQIQAFQPQVIFIDNVHLYNSSFIAKVKRLLPTKPLFVGHVCSADFDTIELQAFDIVLTCLKKFETDFRNRKINAYYFPHAFNTASGNGINVPQQKEMGVFFAGSVLAGAHLHDYRHVLLQKVAHKYTLNFYSSLYHQKPKKSVLEKIQALLAKKVVSSELIDIVQPPLFGKALYQQLTNKLISLNIHAGIAGDEIANMRLFEATGLGSCLITDNKKNLSDFFLPDKEVVVFDSVEECIEKLEWLFDNPAKAAEIAIAGQKRTLTNHTFYNRAEYFKELMQKMI